MLLGATVTWISCFVISLFFSNVGATVGKKNLLYTKEWWKNQNCLFQFIKKPWLKLLLNQMSDVGSVKMLVAWMDGWMEHLLMTTGDEMFELRRWRVHTEKYKNYEKQAQYSGLIRSSCYEKEQQSQWVIQPLCHVLRQQWNTSTGAPDQD